MGELRQQESRRRSNFVYALRGKTRRALKVPEDDDLVDKWIPHLARVARRSGGVLQEFLAGTLVKLSGGWQQKGGGGDGRYGVEEGEPRRGVLKETLVRRGITAGRLGAPKRKEKLMSVAARGRQHYCGPRLQRNTERWWARQKETRGNEHNKLLWGPEDEYHFNKIKRNYAWQEIADWVRIGAEDAKKKMASLLGSFRREKSKEMKSDCT
ncbi:hypothetical protein PR048_004885, partial [Dryococelus australis]